MNTAYKKENTSGLQVKIKGKRTRWAVTVWRVRSSDRLALLLFKFPAAVLRLTMYFFNWSNSYSLSLRLCLWCELWPPPSPPLCPLAVLMVDTAWVLYTEPTTTTCDCLGKSFLILEGIKGMQTILMCNFIFPVARVLHLSGDPGITGRLPSPWRAYSNIFFLIQAEELVSVHWKSAYLH